MQNMHQANMPLRDQPLPADRRADLRSASAELFQVPRSISRKRSAAGARRPPRRLTTPIVRDTSGLPIGRVTMMGCSACGVASLGRTEMPSPASTNPRDVERWVTSYDQLRLTPARTSAASSMMRLPLVRLTATSGCPSRSDHATMSRCGQRVVPSARQDKGIFDQGLERQLRIGRPEKVDAELDLAPRHALEALVRGQVQDPEADVRVLLVEPCDDGRQEVEGCRRHAGERDQTSPLSADIPHREQRRVELIEHAPDERQELPSDGSSRPRAGSCALAGQHRRRPPVSGCGG